MSDVFGCGFCGKSQKEVRHLVAGPMVFICDECVELCSDILADERKSKRDKLRNLLVSGSEPSVKPATPVLQVNAYRLLSECVERGVTAGWRHAHKHTDAPTEAQLLEHLGRDVMNEISNYFTFDPGVGS
jgi:hypothetical protein